MHIVFHLHRLNDSAFRELGNDCFCALSKRTTRKVESLMRAVVAGDVLIELMYDDTCPVADADAEADKWCTCVACL